MQQDQIKFNDIPFGSWFFGLLFLGVGFFLVLVQAGWLTILIFGGIGLLLLLLSWGLTITADRQTQTLILHYWSLYFLRRTTEIPFGDIATIRVASTHSGTRRGQQTRSFRIEVVRKDNSILPFRTTYSSGFFGSIQKQKIVDQLRAFIGLAEAFDESPAGYFRAANKAVAQQAASVQQALTGPNEQEHVTNGVHWYLQSTALATAPVTRWYSPDFKTRDGFLFLAQKVAGQSSGGLMAVVGNALFQQSISMYGFKGNDVPNLARAQMIAPLPPQLDSNFMAYTSSPAESQQIISPWMQHPLADWAQRYPLKQFQSKGGFSQLVILFSPNGVYLATMGVLHPDEVEELTRLGVEMVKTQGVVQAN